MGRRSDDETSRETSDVAGATDHPLRQMQPICAEDHGESGAGANKEHQAPPPRERRQSMADRKRIRRAERPVDNAGAARQAGQRSLGKRRSNRVGKEQQRRKRLPGRMPTA